MKPVSDKIAITRPCILFSHIQVAEREIEGRKESIENLDSYKKVLEYKKYLMPALEAEETVLFLFYDAAWVDFMNVVGADFNFEKFAKSSYVALQISDKFNSQGKENFWVRVITAKHLSHFVNNLRGDRAGEEALRWRRFFVSDQKRMLYDCSKVVEAIIRLRNIGSGIPVLRIDLDILDALLEQEKAKKGVGAKNAQRQKGPHGEVGAEWLRKMLYRAKKNHRHCVESSDVQSFVFSGGYCNEKEVTPEPKDFVEWATAYSTRVFPALLATKELVGHTTDDELTKFANIVELGRAFDDELAKKFYGLPENLNQPEGIIKFGAHPKKAVISGSLFCLSDAAIVDLPPFSNFQSNVIWIDDHLKYALLKDLGQVGQKDIRVPSLDGGGRRKLTARIPNCYLPKGRQKISNFGFYVLGVYLPSLLRGMVMDRWIFCNADQKSKSSSEPTKEKGALTSALRLALARGRLETRDSDALRRQLKELAYQRIEEVWDQWRGLKRDPGGEQFPTFASLWVEGKVSEHAQKLGTEIQDGKGKRPGRDWIGWGLLKAGGEADVFNRNDLVPAFKQDLESLIDDAITYIDWALQWPHFLQSVRVLEPSAGPLDYRTDWGTGRNGTLKRAALKVKQKSNRLRIEARR